MRKWIWYHRCCHRSHRLGVPCLREANYDGFCPPHNSTCFMEECQQNRWFQFMRNAK